MRPKQVRSCPDERCATCEKIKLRLKASEVGKSVSGKSVPEDVSLPEAKRARKVAGKGFDGAVASMFIPVMMDTDGLSALHAATRER
mgnify:CR=1 FL=1